MDEATTRSRVATVAQMAEEVRQIAIVMMKTIQKAHSSPKSPEFKLGESMAWAQRNLAAAVADLVDQVPAHEVTGGDDGTSAHRPEKRTTHEAFGNVQATRVSGSCRLFGSVVDRHMHYIKISVTRATYIEPKCDDPTVWPDSSYDGQIVEFSLSSAQFAELITGMNTGLGTPCTLDYVRGRRMADVPAGVDNRSDRILADFRELMAQAPKENHEAFERFHEILKDAKLTKATAAALTKAASDMHANHGVSMGYILDRYDESAEKAIAAVRTEVDATIGLMAQNLGLERLRVLTRDPQLASSDERAIVTSALPSDVDGER